MSYRGLFNNSLFSVEDCRLIVTSNRNPSIYYNIGSIRKTRVHIITLNY